MSNKKWNKIIKSKLLFKTSRFVLFLYCLYDHVQTTEFQDQLKLIFKGFLRIEEEEVQHGNGRISTGKVPLSFKLYYKLYK